MNLRPLCVIAAVPLFTASPLAVARAQACHSSYELVCVPAGVSDVDCAGGSGNGPYYARGPIRVVGWDEYGLDRDGDGIACER